MNLNKIILNANTRNMELGLVNNLAKYFRGFNDSLLIEDELNLSETQAVKGIFGQCKT